MSDRTLHCGRRTLCAALLGLCVLPVSAQAFLMQGLDGKRQNLHAALPDGQWTLVMFWSLDCIPCEQQKPMIQAFHAAHSGVAAGVVGVALDGHEARDAVLARLDSQPINHPTLLVYGDVFHEQFVEETGQAFRATPTYLLYDPDRRLAGVHVGLLERAQLDSILEPHPLTGEQAKP